MKRKFRPKRIDILQNIFECFQQITQWLPRNFDSCAEYMQKATVLIELLEVCDCGSTGGFDPYNRLIEDDTWKLYRRFLTVLKKYNDEQNIKAVCSFTPESLQQYFKQAEQLREKIESVCLD